MRRRILSVLAVLFLTAPALAAGGGASPVPSPEGCGVSSASPPDLQAALEEAQAAVEGMAVDPEGRIERALGDARAAADRLASEAPGLATSTAEGAAEALASALVDAERAIADAQPRAEGAAADALARAAKAVDDAQALLAQAQGEAGKAASDPVGFVAPYRERGAREFDSVDAASRATARQVLLAGPVVVWTNLNMGAGSCLDADTLDGYHASDLLLEVERERLARIAGDEALHLALNDERALREAADGELSDRLDAARAALEGEIAGVEADLAAARADLESAIEAEAATRKAGLHDLADRIADETTSRAASVAALEAAIADLRADLEAAIASEEAARVAADDAVSARAASLEGHVNGGAFKGSSLDVTHNVALARVGGNVAIGKAAAAAGAKLDVAGSLHVGTGASGERHGITLRGPNSPIRDLSATNLTFDFTGAGKAAISAQRGGLWDTSLRFLTNPAAGPRGVEAVRMIIASEGEVGIGTLTPRAKLDVHGDVRFTGTLQEGTVPWARLAGAPTLSAGAGLTGGGDLSASRTLAIAEEGVTSGMIADGTIATSDLADAAVTTAKMADGAITSLKVADGTIATSDLANAAVTTAKVVDGAITSLKVADGTIADADLADAAVTTAKVTDGAITTLKIADGTIADADVSPTAAIAWGKVSKTGSSLADLTTRSASDLSSGTIPDARLSGTYTGAITLSNAANSFKGSGAGLTALNAGSLATGTVPDARLSGTYSAAITLSNVMNRFTGIGTGLTYLNAGSLTTGTVSDDRLSSNVALLDTRQSFHGAKTFYGGTSFRTGVEIGYAPDAAAMLHVDGDVRWTGKLLAGTVPWPRLSGFPTACPAGKLVHGVGSSLSCATPVPGRPVQSLTTLDGATGDVGGGTAIIVGTNGLPLIAYYDSTNTDLKVAHCDDLACTKATVSTIDASPNDVGQYPSITIGPDGLGLVSYYDATNGDLKVAHCLNVLCSSATSVVVDAPGDVGQYSSIAIGTDGLGLVSYHDATGGALKVAHCINVTCSARTYGAVDSGGRGKFSSLAIGADGLGIVSYYDETAGNLRVAHCTDVACSSATTRVVDSTPFAGRSTSIAIGADGLALVGYLGTTGAPYYRNALKVAHCTDLLCSTAAITSIEGSLNTGPPSVTIGADGFGLVTYYVDAYKDLWVARCSNALCSAAQRFALDTGDDVGLFSSVTIGVDGFGIASYYDQTKGDLKVAHLSNRLGVPNYRPR